MQYDSSLPWRDIHGGGFNRFVGPIQVAEMPDGEMPFSLVLDERHTNSNGVCHGGVLMTIADSGMGACAFVAAGGPVATIDFECDFMAAAPIGERVHGLAKVSRKARNFIFMECDMYAGTTRVIRASGIWARLPEKSRAINPARKP